VAVLSNPVVMTVATQFDEELCAYLNPIYQIDALRLQVFRPSGVDSRVLNLGTAGPPGDLVETSSGFRMIQTRYCGFSACALDVVDEDGSNQAELAPLTTTPRWVRAAASTLDTLVVVTVRPSGLGAPAEVLLQPAGGPPGAVRQLSTVDSTLSERLVVEFVGETAVLVGGAGGFGEPTMVYAALVSADSITERTSLEIQDCGSGGVEAVSGVVLGTRVEVMGLCNNRTSLPFRVTLDASNPQDPQWSMPQVVALDPAPPLPIVGASVFARGGVLGLVFTQGPTLRAAWQAESGGWRHAELSRFAGAESEVGHVVTAQTEDGLVAAWNPGHNVLYATQNELQGCGDDSLTLLQSRLAITTIQF